MPGESTTGFSTTVLALGNLSFSAIVGGPEGRELVLFLHGFPEFADSCLPIMEPIAHAGFRTVAVDQRGYSSGARPAEVQAYAVEHLLSDIAGFADAFGSERFHVVGHDWGALLAWKFAAKHPRRVQSLTALSVPHPDALFQAMQSDPDQQERSKYIAFFRMPGGLAEKYFQEDDCKNLRAVYQGKLPEAQVQSNIRRLSEPGALTSALNWYRALEPGAATGKIAVPTLYIWSTQDMALGETAALATAGHVSAPYRFERIEGASHWVMAEIPQRISSLVLEHIQANRSS